MTRNGIEYDLEKSPYRTEIKGDIDTLTMCFSSNLNKDKFENRLTDFTKQTDESLSKRFGMKLHLPLVSAVALYRKTEKRGFAIYSSKCQKIMYEDDLFCL